MSIIDEAKFYKMVLDPLMNLQHQKILNLIEKDKNIIDIACGTGSLALKMAKDAKFVTGVDFSESMIKEATSTSKKLSISNIKFLVKDATNLNCSQDNEFDIAIISMAVHQFPQKVALAILQQMQRIAKEMIILDYNFPLNTKLNKLIIYTIECLAGKDHFSNFKKYMKKGGILSFLSELSINNTTDSSLENHVFQVIICKYSLLILIYSGGNYGVQ